ncbi:rod shape-determining protein [Thermoactinospora rubra]|uniref:rod shape-determining protein n=1 Tax=Thermoactinospora rubra TaxID=1088767 RepID=UPI000A11E1DB|nr:rod shape-determining protein [Thermoactinospora rubra]
MTPARPPAGATPAQAGESIPRSVVGHGYAALDLGTARTRSFCWGAPAIADRSSAVPARTPATSPTSSAPPQAAAPGPGSEPPGADLIWPIRHGMVADPAACQRLIRDVLADASLVGSWPLRRILVGVPVAATPGDRGALRLAVSRAAGCQAVLVEEPLAAALGAGLDVTDPRPCLLVDVGAGIVEAVAIRDGAVADAVALQLVTSGAGLPSYAIDSVAHMTAELLRGLPARLRSTARAAGLTVTGGGAQQAALLRRLRDALPMPVTVAAAPAHATIRGLTRLCLQPALAARLAADR